MFRIVPLVTVRLVILALALAGASALALRAAGPDVTTYDAELHYQLASVLFDESRYREAMNAFGRATSAKDPALAVRARKGRLRAAIRIAEFDIARQEADALKDAAPADHEAAALQGDALWASGLFDEADTAYTRALDLNRASSRARFGLARSLATRNRLEEALQEALAASSVAPRDPEIHHGIGEIYERLHRFDEAALSLANYINLLPDRDRTDRTTWSRSQLRFLQAFSGKVPVQVDPEDANVLHTVPFKLVKDKIIVQARVNDSRRMDFVLDTGAEETVISRQTASRANVQPITYTLSAGVGEVGLRGLQLGRLDSLEIGTLRVRNLPVLIKNPPLRGIPRREGDSFSPLSLGMSMTIDYQKRLLTIGNDLPEGQSDFRLPMRIHRLAMVRGTLNSTRPAYFVIDTGGQVISISSETANALNARPPRRIPLKVYGVSGWDRDAFLLTGVNLNFDAIEYRNFPLVVLNLRAPSALLGFQLGGIVGHKFLANYRVSLDLARSELRLEKF